MLAGLHALVPIFAYFFLGALLRGLRVAHRDHAPFLFKLVFYATLPALAFGAVSGSALSLTSLSLPLTGILVNLVCAALGVAYARYLGLDAHLTGSLVLAAGISNMVFIFPFVLSILGREALASAILYDVGNAVFVATGGAIIATRYGAGGHSPMKDSVRSILGTPLFPTVVLAIVVSVNGWEVPSLLGSVLQPLGAMTMPLILIALGISFSTAHLTNSVVYGTVVIRMLGGLAVGALLVYLLGLQGATAVTVIAAASAPVGFNAVTFASIGRLDVEHATASLTVSVAIGLVTASAIVLAGAHGLA